MTALGIRLPRLRSAAWRATATAWRWPATAALAALAAVLAFGYTGIARIDLAQRTDAERTLIHSAAPVDDAVTALALTNSAGSSSLTGATQIASITAQMHRWIAASLPLEPADQSWGDLEAPPTRTRPDDVPRSAMPGGLAPRINVEYRDTLDAHARLVAGRWPSAAAVRDTSGDPDAPPVELESVVSTATAALLHARPGTLLDITEHGRTLDIPIRLSIVGVFEPLDTAATFWSAGTYLYAPQYDAPLASPPSWSAGVLIGPAQADFLLSDLGDSLIARWAFPIDSDSTDADQAGALLAAIDRLEQSAAAQYTGPGLAQSPGDQAGTGNTAMPAVALGLDLGSQLPSRLAPFLAAQRVEELELAMPLAGLGLIAAVAVVLLAAAASGERAEESAARRARGASARQVVARVLADGLVTALPAAAVGAAAGLAIPGPTPAGTAASTLLIAASATCGPGIGTAWAEIVRRRARRPAAPSPRSVLGARRWVVRVALVLVCAGGLDLIRSQGLDPGGSTNPYAAAAPVLAAVPFALATLGLLPPALHALLRRSAARRGLVGLLGLAQAADAPLPVQAADLIVTAGVSTAGLTFAVRRLSGRGAVGVLAAATHSMFTALAWTTVAAALLAVALAARLGARTRRAAALQLGAIGMTGGQARAAAVVETAVPVFAGVFGGTLATLALARLAGPALGVHSVPVAAADLFVPALGALAATGAGAVGTAARAAGRDPAAALRT